MMNNYNNYNYPTGGYYGGSYYQEPPKLNMTQGLTPEQLKSLRKTGGFNLEVSEDELMRSFCTHRQDNKFTVVQDDEGNMTCTLCGTKFKPFEGDVKEARELTNRFIDLVETTKMQALSLPPKTIHDFFQIEPLIRRVPDLFSQSQADYKKALGMNDGYFYGQENNAFAMYQNIINPMAGNGYYDPAMMNMQQPVYGGQPPMMQQPMYGQPMYQQPMMQPQQMYGQPMYQQQGYQPYQQNDNGQQQGNPFNVGSAPVTNQVGGTDKQENVTVTTTMKD